MNQTTGPMVDREVIDFGDLPDAVDQLLQQGVVAYRQDRGLADALFRQALALAPQQLPTYYCLYKIHTYQGNLDEALAMAQAGLHEAARQAGLDGHWTAWQLGTGSWSVPERFALYTLKALAFIRLRRRENGEASRILGELARLDPHGAVGWGVVEDLARGLA
jgi:tetratricopeptide (TPR) repeat protein